MDQQLHPQQLSGQSQGDQPALPSSPKPPSVSHQCRFCGAEMRPNKSFCPKCGAQLAPVPQPPVQNPYAKARTQRAAEPTQFATPGGGQKTPSLEIEFNHGGKSTYDLTKPVINIGRDPSNDIVIDTPVVSHFHAQIVREGNQLILVHPHPSQPHTTNGLLYQGRHILGNEPFRKPLVCGDIFRIGDEHGTLVTLTYNDGSRAPQDIVPQIRPLPVGAPVSSSGSQPQSPQAQPPGAPSPPSPAPAPKPPDTMSTPVKAVAITTLGTVLVAIITYILAPIVITPSPSIPILHPFYSGSYAGLNSTADSGRLTFNVISQDKQGDITARINYVTSNGSSGSDSCTGDVTSRGEILLKCTASKDVQGTIQANGHIQAVETDFYRNGSKNSFEWSLDQVGAYRQIIKWAVLEHKFFISTDTLLLQSFVRRDKGTHSLLY